MTRSLLVALVCAITLLSLPAATRAATVSGSRVLVEDEPNYDPVYELQVRYEDREGESNDVAVTISENHVAFEDSSAELEAEGLCTRATPHRVECSSGDEGLSLRNVVLGDGDDSVRFNPGQHYVVRVSGGAGNDDILGTDDTDHLFGGPGDDTVDGGPGGDTIDGGLGSDVLRAGPADLYDIVLDGDTDRHKSPDTIIGQPGRTTLTYRERKRPVHVDLRNGTGGAPGEGDTFTGINLVQGGAGDDVLYGTSLGDFIRGNDGDDLIRAREGDDGVQGNRGRDRVYGGADDDLASDDSDNAVDSQHCGPGEDFVSSSDKRDVLRRCEDGAWTTSPDSGDVNRITAQPALSRRLAVFRSTCREVPNCSGRILLKERGSRKVLGRGRFEFRRYGGNPDNAPRHEIVAVLNKRGRKWVGEGGYVRVTIVSQHDCNGCLNPEPPARTGFTSYMRR